MAGMNFAIEGAQSIQFAAAPAIGFTLRVTNSRPTQSVESIALRCQILIESQRRHYAPAERPGLRDLFGEPERWGQTLKPLLWTHANVTVPAFTGSITAEAPVPCSFDFNIAATKYFYAIEDGDIPLVFQFSGTIFTCTPEGSMQIEQVGWDKEARFRMPARVWRDMMDHYYPNSAWLRLRRDVFDRLSDYKQSHGLATFEQAIESLVPAREKGAAS